MSTAVDDLWYSRSEVIDHLRVSRSTVWRLSATGQIRTRLIGKRRYWAADVDRLAIQFNGSTDVVHGAKDA